jgi:hypothetical protein
MNNYTSDFYTPLRGALPPLELDIRIPNRLTGAIHRVHLTARHLLYREFIGLEDLLIGEVQPIADPTGKQMMKIRRLKLKAVAIKVSNLNPAIYPGGEISAKEEVEKWVDADENSDAVWASWQVFEAMIDNPQVKRSTEGSGDGGGKDSGEPEETRPDAQLRAVYGRVADGEGDGRPVSGGYGNGSVSDAGESGVETEAVAGVPV